MSLGSSGIVFHAPRTKMILRFAGLSPAYRIFRRHTPMERRSQAGILRDPSTWFVQSLKRLNIEISKPRELFLSDRHGLTAIRLVWPTSASTLGCSGTTNSGGWCCPEPRMAESIRFCELRKLAAALENAIIAVGSKSGGPQVIPKNLVLGTIS